MSPAAGQENRHQARRKRSGNATLELDGAPKSSSKKIHEDLEELERNEERFERIWAQAMEQEAADRRSVQRGQRQRQQLGCLPSKASTISFDSTGNSEDRTRALLKRALGSTLRGHASSEGLHRRQRNESHMHLIRSLWRTLDQAPPGFRDEVRNQAQSPHEASSGPSERFTQKYQPLSTPATDRPYIYAREHEPQYYCNLCGIRLESQSQMDIHLLRHARRQTANDCKTCGEPFSFEKDLQEHFRTAHIGDGLYCPHVSCWFGKATPMAREDLHRHALMAHGLQSYQVDDAIRRGKYITSS